MTEAERTTKVRVETNESLPEVLDRLRAVPPGEVTLEVPEHCPLLLTATEFRALKNTAEQQHLRLSFETDDRLRQQLAAMFGLAPAAPPPTLAEPRQTSSPGGHSLGGWRRARRATADADGAAAGDATAENDPIAVSRRRRTQHYEPGFAGQAGQAEQQRELNAGAAETESEELTGAGALDYLNEDARRGPSARTLGRIVAIVAVLALAGVIAAWYLLPGVSVAVTLEQTPVSTDLIYSVAAPGAPIPSDASFAVEATEEDAEVSFTLSIPTTGVRREPDQTAAGTVELRNPGDEAVMVEEGTELTTLAGGVYVTAEEVEVPAADDGPGQAEATVNAAEPGEQGNLRQGYLTGELADQGIFYSNRQAPIEGGTDRENPVVSENDVATIQERAEADLQQLTADAWAEQLPEGQALVAPSVAPSEPKLRVEQEPGAEVDTLTLSGTVDATGLVYSLEEVRRQSRQSVADRLTEQVPPNYQLDEDAITLGEPEEIAEAPEILQYQVSATGVARAVFTEQQQEELAASLVGASDAEAAAAIAAQPAITAADIDYSPSWWFERMPRLESRISIDVQVGTVPSTDGTPPATPSEDSGLRTQGSASLPRPSALDPRPS